ncbi:peptidylprolyl isomerase [Candidatus Sumerlaeota bacterium]|nr:peptidylprolyl isomerase [Candidatus Sumerlaeota bacterium]
MPRLCHLIPHFSMVAVICLAVPADPPDPGAVLATWEGGELTVEDLQARWWLSLFPAPEILEDLASTEHSISTERAPRLQTLADEAREASLDLILLERSERENWPADPLAMHRARRLLVSRHLPLWEQRIESELPPPTSEELGPHLDEISQQPPVPERRSARLIFLPVEPGSGVSDELRAEGQRALERLEAGEDFGALAEELSQGPGWSRGGHLEPMTEEQAPWPELGHAIFAAPESGEPVISVGEMGVYIIEIESVEPARGPSDEELQAIAAASWRRDETDRRIQSTLRRWRDESGYQLSEEASQDDDPLITVGSDTLTLGQFRELNPGLSAAELQGALDEYVTVEVLARHLGEIFPPREVELHARGALAAQRRAAWERELTAGLTVSEEAVQRVYEATVSQGGYRTHPQRHILLCRVMPDPPGVTPTPDSLRRLRGLDSEAKRVLGEISALVTSPEAFAERIGALDASSEWTIESLDMGLTTTPPAFLGQLFHSMEAGDLSPVIAPREDVRLIYAVAALIPRRTMTFAEAAPLAESIALSERRHADLRAAREGLLEAVNWELTFSVPEP